MLSKWKMMADPEKNKRGGEENLLFSLPRTPALAGILNLTEDSFSDGGKYFHLRDALSRGEKLLREGAFLLDVGAESTRPGAREIPAEKELEKIRPFLCAFREKFPRAVISIDTRKSVVAEEALKLGADMINDVSGLRFDPAMGEVIAKYRCFVILMHSRGLPENMQNKENLDYGEEFFSTFCNEVEEMVENALSYGIRRERIILDPGLGFAKTPEQNWELIRNCPLLRKRFQLPLFYGCSRKSFLGFPMGKTLPMEERESVNLAILGFLADGGASFCRVHDVKSAMNYLAAHFCLREGKSE